MGRLAEGAIERPRPDIDLVHVVARLNSHSFPSGHVLFFTTFFGFLMVLAWVRVEPSWWRMVAVLAMCALRALVGLSRIYQGQHWASDVLAAYLLGAVCLSVAVFFYRWGKRRNRSLAS